jgi:hypothetical protein
MARASAAAEPPWQPRISSFAATPHGLSSATSPASSVGGDAPRGEEEEGCLEGQA